MLSIVMIHAVIAVIPSFSVVYFEFYNYFRKVWKMVCENYKQTCCPGYEGPNCERGKENILHLIW